MNIEHRLRAELNRAGVPPPSDSEGLTAFLERAHHRVLVRRAVAAFASVVILGIGAVGATALMGNNRGTSLPPIARATTSDRRTTETPNALQDQAPPTDCIAAKFETGELGALAYARGRDVRVVDVESSADRIVVEGIGSHRRVSGDDTVYDLKWSPDGQWILANGGTVIPAAGRGMCAPLGRDVDAGKWLRGSDATLVATTKIGGLALGGPGQDRREILPDDWGVQDFVLDPGGRLALVHRSYGGRPGLYIVDLQTSQARPLFIPFEDDAIYPQPATWSPDGRWIFFWATNAQLPSVAIDGAPLWAMPVSGGSPVQVIGKMLQNRDFLTWCGNTLVSAAGGGRAVTERKRLMTTTIPDLRTEPFATSDSKSFFAPQCSPSADAVATTWTSVVGREAGQTAVTVLSFPEAGEGNLIAMFGASSGRAPVWSADGERILFVRTEGDAGSPKLVLTDWVAEGEDAQGISTQIADLGHTSVGYGPSFGTRRFDWYQP
jgi:hypothetical protein